MDVFVITFIAVVNRTTSMGIKAIRQELDSMAIPTFRRLGWF
jgi:hypothetical protein